MNKSLLQLVLISLIMALFACSKRDQISPAVNRAEEATGTVSDQLKASREALAIRKIPAKILSFKNEATIHNEAQLKTVQNRLTNNAAVVPQFDGTDVNTFSVSTIQQRMLLYQANSNNEQNVVENIRQVAFPMLKVGQRVIDILWEAAGKQFHSVCVYNDDGIVYDNMLSNITFIDAETPAADEIKSLPEPTESGITPGSANRALAQYSFTSTVRDYTITWVWGGTRGKIIIKHYIIWNGSNYIYDHGGSTDAWMSAGSASARWANNSLSRYSVSKMAWGYGWATPTASFNITFNSSNLTFSAGTSGVGSKGSGAGIHTIYI